MLLASVLVVNSCLSAVELTIEQVAPEQTVMAVSFADVGSMVDRLRNSPAKEYLANFDGMKDEFLDRDSRMADVWKEALADKALLEVIESLSGGMAVYPVVDQETTAVTIGTTLFINLGDSVDELGSVWDQAMERAQEDEGDSMEIQEIADVEVIKFEPVDDEDGGDDPFGDGGGMGMGMSMENAFPLRFYLVRVEEHILFSTSRTQMERMLDILAERDVDGGLSESDTWKGITESLGKGGVRVVVLTDHLGEMMKGFGQPFIVDMVKPMIVAMFGRIDAMGFSMQAASAPALATMQMGVWMPEGKSGLMKLMSRNSPRGPMPGWLSADTVSYQRLNFDFDGVIPWLNSVINSNPMIAMQAGQAMEQVEPMLKKVLAGMGSTVRMYDGISFPLTAESATSLAAVEAKDAKAFTDALAEVAPQMGFEPRDFQGHQVYSVDMSEMMGGMMSLEMGVAVGGSEIFMGSLSAVEQALRSVGERPSEDSSIAKAFAPMEKYFSTEPVVMWCVADLASSMRAGAEINEMRLKSEMNRLEDQDPELAEELAELMGDDEEADAMFAGLADCFGLVGYEIMSDDNGFTGRGWVLEPTED